MIVYRHYEVFTDPGRFETGVLSLANVCGYFLGTHEGSQVLYVDPAGIIHVFVNGAIGAHAGDGQWFYTPGYKVSEPRAVTLDPQGNLLITESDSGYVRRVEFMRLSP